jgi:GR25 family glycosyltransferase involved in LPS biosynthesis
MIDKYYMCHYQKLSERRVYVESVVKKHNIDLDWVLDYDKEVIDKDQLVKEMPMIFSDWFGRSLSMAEISLVLKHRFIYEDVIKNGYQNVVVFEDDIILVDDFIEKMDSYMQQLPKDYDFLWIGTCCGLKHQPQINGLNVYRNQHGSRCTHAYVISNKACETILGRFADAYQPIDWILNSAIRDLNMNNFWAEPALSTQDLSFDSSINCGMVQ